MKASWLQKNTNKTGWQPTNSPFSRADILIPERGQASCQPITEKKIIVA